ncbi:hypothetical protein C8J56DRAFT_1040789 [Mycena floridula]|nr:hypothetical protein C8J56DRAFT_1040789 [Mycena floridula]
MRSLVILSIISVLVIRALALPAAIPQTPNDQTVLLFDGLGVQSADGSVKATIQSFVYRTPRISKPGFFQRLKSALTPTVLKDAWKRFNLLAAHPVKANTVIRVTGCSSSITVPSGSDGKGLVENKSIGRCNGAQGKDVKYFPSQAAGNNTPAKIFTSGPGGIGILSDIDDTIKISHVPNKLKLAQTTLFEPPVAVPHMSELYASLAQSLKDPVFVYVSGSPYVLYPFLRQFLTTSFSASPGPVFLRDLSITSLSSLIAFFKKSNIIDFKTDTIRRVKGIYPDKKWIFVGDSGENDATTYASIYRQYPEMVACIWIRRTPDKGVDNSVARFTKVFQGVPKNKYHTFPDSEIPSLKAINVAEGKCN